MDEHRPFAATIAGHALAIPPLSLAGGALFYVAQPTKSFRNGDVRHIEAWIAWTVLLVVAWVITCIYEYRRRRREGRWRADATA